MSKPNHTLPENYFNDVYSHNEDPWNFETSEYERAKYEATIKVLPKETYEEAFEIGCSIGVLTKMLASKSKHLLAIDSAEAPLIKARKQVENLPQVTIQKMTIPDQFPQLIFDLIVVSEVGYYLSVEDLHKLILKIISQLQQGGHLILVHWTPVVPDYPLTGDEVHDTFMQETGEGKHFKHLLNQRQEKYRLDLFEKI